MNEFLKEYISLKENFVKQHENEASVLALYEFADRLKVRTEKEAMEVLVDVYQLLYKMESAYKLYEIYMIKQTENRLKSIWG